jgi:hypothetical protein
MELSSCEEQKTRLSVIELGVVIERGADSDCSVPSVSSVIKPSVLDARMMGTYGTRFAAASSFTTSH